MNNGDWRNEARIHKYLTKNCYLYSNQNFTIKILPTDAFVMEISAIQPGLF